MPDFAFSAAASAAASPRFSGADSFIRAALTGLSARQRTIANNVANIDTPNFKASEVRFEEVLRGAMTRRGAEPSQASLNALVSRSSFVDGTTTRADGNNVDIDREMELLGETQLTYSALTQVMSTRLGILRSVVGGR
jgi:flagellar basal-body rod protein FlgB